MVGMRMLRLLHAQITIPTGEEEAARRFYCGMLGLVEIAKPAALVGRGGFWLQLGELQIHIGTEGGVDRAATKAHLAYEVADLAAWRVRLTEAGCTILDGIPIPGYDRFKARDPFGNRIELIEREE
jgi:catechol 2,3-dioxygenase-like lactoylglutathione lyase family enzyme